MTLISYHNLISNITTVLPKATQVLCNRLTTILLLIAFLSACNMTSTPASTITVDTSIITVERMSTQCITQVQTQQNAMNASQRRLMRRMLAGFEPFDDGIFCPCRGGKALMLEVNQPGVGITATTNAEGDKCHSAVPLLDSISSGFPCTK